MKATEARSETAPVEAESRVRRHLDALWETEAGVRAALGDAHENQQVLDGYAGDLDWRLRMVEAEVDLTAAMRAAAVAPDAAAFAEAIDAELAAWRLYVERLQGRAATRPGSARMEAEEAVRDLRRLLTALTHRADEFRAAPAGDWRERSAPARAASSELARAADELPRTFD